MYTIQMNKSKPFLKAPLSHACGWCNEQVNLSDYRMLFGIKFCSIICEDLHEERNQGKDYEMTFHEDREDELC